MNNQAIHTDQLNLIKLIQHGNHGQAEEANQQALPILHELRVTNMRKLQMSDQLSKSKAIQKYNHLRIVPHNVTVSTSDKYKQRGNEKEEDE